MKAILIGGGNPPSLELLNKEISDDTIIICADGGANCMYKYNLVPNYIIGDFDSIDKNIFSYFKNMHNCKIETYPPEKDFTDLNIIFNKAIELGCKEMVILGCTGTRLDHTFAALGILKKCLRLNIKSEIKDENNTIYLTDKSIKIKYNEEKKYLSFLSYGEEVLELNIKGAKYDLNSYDLQVGDDITVSNEFLPNKDVEINFKSGLLLIFQSKD